MIRTVHTQIKQMTVERHSQYGTFCVKSCSAKLLELISHHCRIGLLLTHDPLTSTWHQINSTGSMCINVRDRQREGRMIIVLLWHTGGRKRRGGIGGSREGQTECQSRRVASPVCNQHLYPSSLAAAEHCKTAYHICLSTHRNTKFRQRQEAVRELLLCVLPPQ